MGSDKTNCEINEDLELVQSLVLRFPIGCACYKTIFSETGVVSDYVIVGFNPQFERLIDLKKEQLTGKRVTEAFQRIKPKAIQYILSLGNKAHQNRDTSVEFHISVFNHAYKVSLLYVTNTLMLGLYQDIPPQAYRKLYKNTIPYEVILHNIAAHMPDSCRSHNREQHNSCVVDETLSDMEADAKSPLLFFEPECAFPDTDDLMFRDALTGLYDRLFALSALKMYIARGMMPLSVALGDINGLNMLNETMGYSVGDNTLVNVARVLRSQCRADDIVARWGGDEFLILLPYTSGQETQQVLKRLQTAFNSQHGTGDCTLVTFGYATAENEPCTAEALIREAEKWVYQKKLLVNRSYRSGILRLLLSTLHEKNTDTQEHSQRMTDYCRKIATRLGLSSRAVNDLILLSMLHDIGKIGIRYEILNKPGPLTPEERLQIEKHPEIGFRIAQNIPELSQVSKYILAHHERWDGTGYPNRLRSKEIPLASRIVAVVDAFDVMISGRPYQPARSIHDALKELERCSGTQFDPNIVEIMVDLVQSQEAGFSPNMDLPML